MTTTKIEHMKVTNASLRRFAKSKLGEYCKKINDEWWSMETNRCISDADMRAEAQAEIEAVRDGIAYRPKWM